MSRAVLDTSVLVRLFSGDDAAKTAAVRAMLDKAEDGSLHFPDVAVAELGFVLRHSLRMPPEYVADSLRAVVSHRAINVPQAAIWLDVADDLESGQTLVDAYLMRTAEAIGAQEFLTFDTRLKPLARVLCREP